jgi:hypothetical protein
VTQFDLGRVQAYGRRAYGELGISRISVSLRCLIQSVRRPGSPSAKSIVTSASVYAPEVSYTGKGGFSSTPRL